jgi:hypothetical protein
VQKGVRWISREIGKKRNGGVTAFLNAPQNEGRFVLFILLFDCLVFCRAFPPVETRFETFVNTSDAKPPGGLSILENRIAVRRRLIYG